MHQKLTSCYGVQFHINQCSSIQQSHLFTCILILTEGHAFSAAMKFASFRSVSA
jgi:hypothetical protein